MRSVLRTAFFILSTALLTGCVVAKDFADSIGSGTGPRSAMSSSTRSPEPLYRLMTDTDVALANGALDRALEHNRSGVRASWRNRGSGNHGRITPLRTYRANGGGYCRDYQEELVVGTDSELYTATACRDPAGLWQPIN